MDLFGGDGVGDQQYELMLHRGNGVSGAFNLLRSCSGDGRCERAGQAADAVGVSVRVVAHTTGTATVTRSAANGQVPMEFGSPPALVERLPWRSAATLRESCRTRFRRHGRCRRRKRVSGAWPCRSRSACHPILATVTSCDVF